MYIILSYFIKNKICVSIDKICVYAYKHVDVTALNIHRKKSGKIQDMNNIYIQEVKLGLKEGLGLKEAHIVPVYSSLSF